MSISKKDLKKIIKEEILKEALSPQEIVDQIGGIITSASSQGGISPSKGKLLRNLFDKLGTTETGRIIAKRLEGDEQFQRLLRVASGQASPEDMEQYAGEAPGQQEFELGMPAPQGADPRTLEQFGFTQADAFSQQGQTPIFNYAFDEKGVPTKEALPGGLVYSLKKAVPSSFKRDQAGELIVSFLMSKGLLGAGQIAESKLKENLEEKDLLPCSVRNHSSMQNIESITKDLYNFAQKFLGFDKSATIAYESLGEKARKVFAPTGNYNPTTRTITIFVDHRHPKDILRSLAHELVHHGQNCRGEFKRDMDTILGYAQDNPHMREMEIEAYKNGNIMLFRDWEDNYKQRSNQMIKENKDIIEAIATRTIENVQKMLQQEAGMATRRIDKSSPLIGSDKSKTGRVKSPVTAIAEDEVEEGQITTGPQAGKVERPGAHFAGKKQGPVSSTKEEGLGASVGTSTQVARPTAPKQGPSKRFKRGSADEGMEEGAPTPPYAKPGQAAAKKASYVGRPGTYGSGGTGGSGAQAKMAGNPASAKRDDRGVETWFEENQEIAEETLEETEKPQELKESQDQWRNRMLYEMTFKKFLPKKK